jgi:flagellar motor switch/type III secretory pathway protein FliN
VLAGGIARIIRVSDGVLDDPYAAVAVVRVGGAAIEVHGANAVVRRIAQRLLGGPEELAAPRPPTTIEAATWALVVGAALEDLGVAGEVWPLERAGTPREAVRELVLEAILGDAPATIGIRAPRSLALRMPPAAAPRAWTSTAMLDVPIVIGRSALPKAELARLAVRSVITLDRVGPAVAGKLVAELVVLGGAVGVTIETSTSTMAATVAIGYSARSMAQLDDAHVELSVGLGTTQLSLRQVVELAVGQVVPLGRPLAGPFEIRAAGKLVGKGELVDVEGELGVRITSLEE